MFAKKYKSIIVAINNAFEGIYTLEFKSLGRRYKYYPGQFLHLAIDTEYDGVGQWPESRCFSMQSNPDEETIRITYAVKGKFTTQMKESLHIGDEVWLKLPYGDLFIQENKKQNAVFIAGGTGITPFLSLFTHELFNEYINSRIYLGFRTKEFNIYKSELKRLCNSNSFLELYYEDKDGMINIEQIFKKNGISSNYFISGPPNMIKNFKNYLLKKGLDEKKIITDDWG